MNRFNLKETTQKRIISIGATVLCVLLFLWYVLLGCELFLNTSIILHNTSMVQNDSSKVKVKEIEKDGSIILSTGRELKDSDVSEYIMVRKGTGTWYVPDNKMSAEVVQSDAIGLGLRFMIVDWAVYLACILILINYRSSFVKGFCILIAFALREVISYIILDYYITNILNYTFSASSLLCLVRFLSVTVAYCVWSVYSGKREKN